MSKYKELLDFETGEVIRVAKGQNFVKMYRSNMAKMLKVIGGKKVKVIIYILNNIKLTDNTFIATQREIAKACEISTKTVNETFKGLSEEGLLKKREGAYMLSPELFYRGDENRKNHILREFNSFNQQNN